MLNLPPLFPSTDARLKWRLSEQIRLLGAAGFPRVKFSGESLDGKAQGEELNMALAASWENGGWPSICIEDRSDFALQSIQAGQRPWDLLACDHADIGPVTTTEDDSGPSLGLEGLRQGCSILRGKGILPVATGGLTIEDAGSCFEAGAESLALSREILLAANPSELLWRAQCLRWRVRPPFRAGQGVALIGGSGCGKSTLAHLLGARLGLPVQDLDESIVQKAGKSIARLFSEEGEPAFRDLETEMTCAAFQSPAVLALGGGAWESEAVRNAARASGYAILWIAVNPGRIWQRVARDPVRPLAQERTAFLARWRTRLPRWLEAPMILPLGRSPSQLASTLQESSGS